MGSLQHMLGRYVMSAVTVQQGTVVHQKGSADRHVVCKITHLADAYLGGCCQPGAGKRALSAQANQSVVPVWN